jgi:hypothetical protein
VGHVWLVDRWRWLILLITPGPILWGSIALSKYARSDATQHEPSHNEIAPPLKQTNDHATVQLVAFAEPVDEILHAACETRAADLRQALGEKCEVIVASPFVAAGDMSLDELTKWHQQTIHPAAAAMASRYFEQRPDQPITVLLFATKDSYEHYAHQLYRDQGISVYGYYKPRERTLVMNISTGGGTLVHELTHALVAFDCPDVPDWFNEGLASLHEQCRFREDARGPWIEGLINWRLTRIQQELAAERLPSLADFAVDVDFRGEREAVNYAQARYFCLYLQRRGLLEKFYTQLRANIDDDPRGLQAIKAVFPDRSWPEIDADFAEFLRALKATE